jgi:hypothetical protein
MRLLVCGRRHLDDACLIRQQLDNLHAAVPVMVLIHGGHAVFGAILEEWARENLVHVVRYPPNWQHLGKRAEAVRNEFMITDSRPDCLLALPGGRHSLDLLRRAQAAGITIVGEINLEEAQEAEDEDEEERRPAGAEAISLSHH